MSAAARGALFMVGLVAQACQCSEEAPAALLQPVADGSCEIEGRRFPPGTTGIPDEDGCNRLSCLRGDVVTTLMACRSGVCIVNGQTYENGSSAVPDPRSCNTCSCRDGVLEICTEASCPLPPPCRFGAMHYQHGRGFRSDDGGTDCRCGAGEFECGPADPRRPPPL